MLSDLGVFSLFNHLASLTRVNYILSSSDSTCGGNFSGCVVVVVLVLVIDEVRSATYLVQYNFLLHQNNNNEIISIEY